MAVGSSHYKVAQAVRNTVLGDTEITDVLPESQWRTVQKKAWHRGQTWEPGGHFVPMKRTYPAHENVTLRIVCPVLVAAVWPSDQDLTDEQETRMALAQRIEDLFAWKGRRLSSGFMTDLDMALSGDYAFKFEQTRVTPGDDFLESAFVSGFDGCGVVVNVDVIKSKIDSSGITA